MTFRNTTSNSFPGSIMLVGPNNNSTPIYVQPSITNFPGFPSTFVGTANANLAVNQTADGITFVDGNTLAKEVTTLAAIVVANLATTQLKFNTQTVGAMSYNVVTGDVLITQTGWYQVEIDGWMDTPDAGVSYTVGLTDGLGGLLSAKASRQCDGVVSNTHVSCLLYLTIGSNLGFFASNSSGAPQPIGNAFVPTNKLTIKYIW